MAKYNLIVSDPPWKFKDKLSMSSVKRGAAANYPELDIEAIKNLDVKSLAADNAVCFLWVPSSLLKDGLEALENYGFDLKQTAVWGKRKKDPLEEIRKLLNKEKRNIIKNLDKENVEQSFQHLMSALDEFDFNNIFQMFMGRTFRNCHEIILVGTRGSVYKYREGKNLRSLFLDPVGKHSEKPEILQSRVEKMFPTFFNRLEMFARRARPGWTAVGSECPLSLGEDIRESIKRLQKLP